MSKKSFKEFCKGIVNKIPSIAQDVIEVVASPNPAGAVVKKVGELLKSKAEKEEEARKALVEFEQYQLEWEKEMYQLQIEAYKAEVSDRQSAREKYIQADRESADEIGRQIINRNLTYIFILLLVQVLVTLSAVFLANQFIVEKQTAVTIGSSLGSVVGTAIGTVVGSLLQERNQVVGFHFGSSMGSRQKDYR
jgi:vacuolar-type H+-ATPase subunit I/STV1